jgi:hypothetical protein
MHPAPRVELTRGGLSGPFGRLAFNQSCHRTGHSRLPRHKQPRSDPAHPREHERRCRLPLHERRAIRQLRVRPVTMPRSIATGASDPRSAGDWTRRPRCLPHELCRSRRPILWQRHRADGPVPVIKGTVILLQARKMRIALGFHASKSVNGDSICILFGKSEHRQLLGRPKPRWHQVDLNNVMTGNSSSVSGTTRCGVVYSPGMIRISRRTPPPRAASASR